ncbi:MAG: hypothetical protein BWX99_00389 [Deltaproteobacteria bacterium ADurb.Bin151]|jgi:hypothetical protein|nr:MAG: hypothetical protein BWX99_00389 [Deltaproteobacteria bacterium ADurb.Bin151]
MKVFVCSIMFMFVLFLLMSCSPVTIQKCVKDYKYDGDKLKSEYTECVVQTPDKLPPLHLKHQELFE